MAEDGALVDAASRRRMQEFCDETRYYTKDVLRCWDLRNDLISLLRPKRKTHRNPMGIRAMVDVCPVLADDHPIRREYQSAISLWENYTAWRASLEATSTLFYLLKTNDLGIENLLGDA